jgi:RNA polymerase sigma factor (sigma-70 family)
MEGALMLPGTQPGRDRVKPSARFPQTSWELLADAAADNRGGPALTEFSDRYYAAIVAYIAAIVRDSADPRDLTHQFFESVVLSRRLFAGVNRSRGTFRPYLKQAIRNFLIDDYRRRHRRQALEGPEVHPDTAAGGWDLVAADHTPAPDEAFQRAWAQSLVRIAMARVRTACDQKGQAEHFQLFVGRYLADPEPSWRELGDRVGLDEKTARSRADTVARRFRATLRELIASDLTSADNVDDEIRRLIALQE